MSPRDDPQSLDLIFQKAVKAIDAGDVQALEQLLDAHPRLVDHRLDSPGAWLRALVGDALDGYFRHPYLLWFVAGNPVRNESLPRNIGDATRAIVRVAQRESVDTLQEQLDTTLGLVVTGRVARECGVQAELVDVLVDAGAFAGGSVHGALGARNLAGAEQLLAHGAEPTLAAACCLCGEEEIARLGRTANALDRQIALAAAALNGKTAALSRLIELGVDLNAYSTGIHPHATALHHAVDSGCLAAVEVLVNAGAGLGTRDRVYGGTPLDWAEHLERLEIAAYLREREGRR